MRQYLLNIRSYSFLLLAKRNGEQYAHKEYKFLFGVVFAFYYLALVSGLAVLQFKAGIIIPEFLKGGLLTQLIIGGLILSIYGLSVRSLLGWLDDVPPSKNVNPKMLKIIKKQFYLTLIGGVAALVLTPWLLTLVVG